MKDLTGKVVSVKMSKTVVVEVERMVKHPLYKKIIKKSRKFKAHNENLELSEGDTVSIAPTRPISREKHFKVTAKL